MWKEVKAGWLVSGEQRFEHHWKKKSCKIHTNKCFIELCSSDTVLFSLPRTHREKCCMLKLVAEWASALKNKKTDLCGIYNGIKVATNLFERIGFHVICALHGDLEQPDQGHMGGNKSHRIHLRTLCELNLYELKAAWFVALSSYQSLNVLSVLQQAARQNPTSRINGTEIKPRCDWEATEKWLVGFEPNTHPNKLE